MKNKNWKQKIKEFFSKVFHCRSPWERDERILKEDLEELHQMLEDYKREHNL